MSEWTILKKCIIMRSSRMLHIKLYTKINDNSYVIVIHSTMYSEKIIIGTVKKKIIVISIKIVLFLV